MQIHAASVEEYLDQLPADRRAALEALRAVFRENLDSDYEEGIQYGMIGYYIPHRIYAAGYHCDPKQPLPFGGIASQKNHLSLYLMCVYGDGEAARRFQEAWKKTGKKLDMGKACVRFKKIDDVPLEVIAETLRNMPAKNYIAYYEAAIQSRPAKSAAAKRSAKPKTASKSAKKTPRPKAKAAARKKTAADGGRKKAGKAR